MKDTREAEKAMDSEDEPDETDDFFSWQKDSLGCPRMMKSHLLAIQEWKAK
jgi:hypothetical protein